MGTGFAPRVKIKNQALFNDNRMGGIQLRQSGNNIKGKKYALGSTLNQNFSNSSPNTQCMVLFTYTFRLVLVVC